MNVTRAMIRVCGMVGAAAIALSAGCIAIVVHDDGEPSSYHSRKAPRIGVTLADLGAGTAAQAGVDAARSSIITSVVSNDPAAKAGIQQWDIITHVDGRDWATESAVRDAIRSKHAGDTIQFRIVRQGKPMELTVSVTGS